MSIFQDVTLGWDGKEYHVPADRVMMLIAKVEDCVSLSELVRTSGAPMAKVAMGYAAALQFAGCKDVSAEDIYSSMFKDGESDKIVDAVTALVMMMIPPDEYAPQADDSQQAEGKKKSKKATGKS